MLNPIPHFYDIPAPSPFSHTALALPSSIRTDINIPCPPELGAFVVSPTAVHFDILHRLIPCIFIKPKDVTRQRRFQYSNLEDEYVDEVNFIDDKNSAKNSINSIDLPRDMDEDLLEYISIENTSINRILLQQAQLGFTFDTAPSAICALLQKEKCNEKSLSDDEDAWEHEINVLYRSLFAINLKALSNILNAPHAWAFTIALEPSPYFGFGGLEARICVLTSTLALNSFHLMGIHDPETDIPHLHEVINTLCATSRLKLLGIVAQLSDEQHHSIIGGMTSRVIAYFMRLAPRIPAFFTPDQAAKGYIPPMYPRALGATSTEEIRELVDLYRERLQVSWNEEQIEEILAEHSTLCEMKGDEICDVDGNDEDKSFEDVWKFAGDTLLSLRKFVGGLACAFLYKPSSMARVPVKTFGEKSCQGLQVRQAAEVILQARQFIQMRKFLK